MKELLFLCIVYTAVIAVALLVFSAQIGRLAHPQEKSFLASPTAALTLTGVVALICLPALDIALLSSTNLQNLGITKDSVSAAQLASIVFWTKVTYISVLSFIAFLIAVATPFSWIFFEEWDDETSNGSRVASAMKWTGALVITLAVLFALGLVIPTASRVPPNTPGGIDFEYLKHLLEKSKPTKSLLFVLGLVTCLGTCIAINYLSPGLATLPLSLLKSQPAQSSDSESDIAVNLELNRQQQRQIALKYEGTRQRMPIKERRTLESLQRRERAMIRSQRLNSQSRSRLFKVLSRPVHYLLGLLFLLTSLLIMAISGLTSLNDLFIKLHNRIPTLKLLSALPYQLSFALHLLLALYLILALSSGIQALSLRFLWFKLFPLRPSKSPPQALLSYAVLSAIAVFGSQVLLGTIVGEEYLAFGSQSVCTGDSIAACAGNRELVKSCAMVRNATDVVDFEEKCIRSVISRVHVATLVTFPVFKTVLMWGQVAIVGVFICSLVVTISKKARSSSSDDEDEDEDNDEEGRVGATERTRLL